MSKPSERIKEEHLIINFNGKELRFVNLASCSDVRREMDALSERIDTLSELGLERYQALNRRIEALEVFLSDTSTYPKQEFLLHNSKTAWQPEETQREPEPEWCKHIVWLDGRWRNTGPLQIVVDVKDVYSYENFCPICGKARANPPLKQGAEK